jgi:hypothetical protein
MALTQYQRELCRVIAQNRIDSGESYIAGGAALNTLIDSRRLSRDIDLFCDTSAAVAASWKADRGLLEARGYNVLVLREREGFVEAMVAKDNSEVLVQWAADSAFRFFPLVTHVDFGLTLHPFDLATNKVLALVGRLEARDWVDLIRCHEKIQPLGYLAWAASGKDPGFSPAAILEQAGRSARYSETEIASLSFSTEPPSAHDLSQAWHAMLAEARILIAALPPRQTGTCVLDDSGDLFTGDIDQLRVAIADQALGFHRGRIRGAMPQVGR